MTRRRKLLLAIFILALLALPVTGYLINEHYSTHEGGSICDFNDTFNCSVVNQSYFSNLFGALYLDDIAQILGFDIPVSILGFLTYLLIAALAFVGFKRYDLKNKYVNQQTIPKILLAVTFIGFLFSAYLTYVEAFILYAWCIFCVAQAILVTFMFGLSIALRQWKKKTQH